MRAAACRVSAVLHTARDQTRKCPCLHGVRRTFKSGRRQAAPAGPSRANFGSGDAHSMILSARIRIVGGTVKFEPLAVLRLTARLAAAADRRSGRLFLSSGSQADEMTVAKNSARSYDPSPAMKVRGRR